MNKGIVTMVKCPYCDTEWKTEDDIVCHKCIPGLTADIAIQSLFSTIQDLSNLEIMNKERFDYLDKAVNKLISLREDFKKVI